ncbi:putative uncharacterized protein [Roseburia sp. CAG:45]|nr:putative uncharacterized protein [Roseburia sp. CAG:45]
MCLGNCTNLCNRLDGTDFIVGKHNRNQNGIRTDCSFYICRIDTSILIHIKISYLKALSFQPFTGMKNCMMLNLTGDDMFSFFFISFCCCFQCPVIRFTSTCRKIYFFRFRTDSCCNNISGPCYCLAAFLTQCINGRCISIILGKIRKHCLHYPLVRSCCCRIVQID